MNTPNNIHNNILNNNNKTTTNITRLTRQSVPIKLSEALEELSEED
jgi:hypothetical protein